MAKRASSRPTARGAARPAADRRAATVARPQANPSRAQRTEAAEEPQATRQQERATANPPHDSGSAATAPHDPSSQRRTAESRSGAPEEPVCPFSVEQQAEGAKRLVLPAALASALRLDRFIQNKGYRRFLDNLLKEAGSPTDPLEVMMIELLALCYLRAAEVHGRAGQATELEAVAQYNGAAVRLTAEFRKTLLALKVYRGH